MFSRLRSERGFGLIELLMAMTMLNIGILALVAAFNSGAVALKRASKISTAAALADAQMELYRSLTYTAIVLDDTKTKTGTDTTYTGDSVLAGNINNDITTATLCTGSPLSNQCDPSRAALGADRKNYRVDTYITTLTPPNARAVKLVTVVVRDRRSPYTTFARQQSTFDQSTGS